MACQCSLARFLKPPLQGNDRHAQESSHPDCWDVSALRRRIGRIAAEVEIPSTRLWYWKCLWPVASDILTHFRTPRFVPIWTVPLRLILSSSDLTIGVTSDDI